MPSDPLDSNEERAALINCFHDIYENEDSFMGMLKYLNRFAPRPPEGHLALDLYFVMGIQLRKTLVMDRPLSAVGWVSGGVVSTVNLGEGVGLIFEQGTFRVCPPRSDPALITFPALYYNGTRSQTCALHSPLPDEHLSQNQPFPEVLAPIPQILTFHQTPTRILAEMQELYTVEGEDSNRVSPRVIV